MFAWRICLRSHTEPTTAPMRNERTGRSKAESAFLQSLNSRLAEQAMSGKAFAVRNLINSKALVCRPPPPLFPNCPAVRLEACQNNCLTLFPLQPDPRICHESLMDQIKRGATLNRNKSINDRSAPKIYKK